MAVLVYRRVVFEKMIFEYPGGSGKNREGSGESIVWGGL